jgi:hypothetical protein
MNEDIAERYLSPGTYVRYDGMEDGPEFGVVIHCWHNEQILGYDCYVAFFGSAIPKEDISEDLYILRFAATSLTIVDP